MQLKLPLYFINYGYFMLIMIFDSMRQLWHSSQNHFHYDNVSAQFPNLNVQHTHTFEYTYIHICIKDAETK